MPREIWKKGPASTLEADVLRCYACRETDIYCPISKFKKAIGESDYKVKLFEIAEQSGMVTQNLCFEISLERGNEGPIITFKIKESLKPREICNGYVTLSLVETNTVTEDTK